MTRKDSITANPAQRKALLSPLRLEIIGQFTDPEGLTISDIAKRMGRPAASLYYHFGILEKVGLLKKIGTRPGVKRHEAVYEPVATRIEFPASKVGDAVEAMASAFRMAERDLDEAMRGGKASTEGKYRDLTGGRMHFRTDRKTLAEVNKHLVAIEKILTAAAQRKKVPPEADQYLSLTFLLAPLKGRDNK